MKLKPWMFATMFLPETEAHICVEVLSFPTPAKTIMVRTIPGCAGTLREVPTRHLSPLARKPKAVSYAVVHGPATFPFDMLRYDCAVPVNFRLDADSYEVIRDPDWKGSELVVAKVIYSSQQEGQGYTISRWESFGWTCLPFRVETIREVM